MILNHETSRDMNSSDANSSYIIVSNHMILARVELTNPDRLESMMSQWLYIHLATCE